MEELRRWVGLWGNDPRAGGTAGWDDVSRLWRLDSCRVCTVSSGTTLLLPEPKKEGERDLASPSACSPPFPTLSWLTLPGGSKANSAGIVRSYQSQASIAVPLRMESRTNRVFPPHTGKKEPSKMQVWSFLFSAWNSQVAFQLSWGRPKGLSLLLKKDIQLGLQLFGLSFTLTFLLPCCLLNILT